MGMYYVICKYCGEQYFWFSFTPETVARGERCEACWKKLLENVEKEK